MKSDLKIKLIRASPYVLFFYLANKISRFFRAVRISDLGKKILFVVSNFEKAFRNPIPSFYYEDIYVGIICAGILWMLMYLRSMDKKKYRKGVEYGSARCGA